MFRTIDLLQLLLLSFVGAAACSSNKFNRYDSGSATNAVVAGSQRMMERWLLGATIQVIYNV